MEARGGLSEGLGKMEETNISKSRPALNDIRGEEKKEKIREEDVAQLRGDLWKSKHTNDNAAILVIRLGDVIERVLAG
ncbi:hypothetical protein Tco_1255936 [Tanacetum coccineum]